MSSGTHIFLATTAAAFGELTLGLRVADALHAGGERAVFLAPRDFSLLLASTPHRHVAVDESLYTLDQVVRRLLAAEHAQSVVLVDVASVFMHLDQLCADHSFLARLPVPVVALDFWNLREAGPEWDYGTGATEVPAAARAIERRLVPAPIARPTPAPAGVFAALPEEAATPAAEREAARAEWGIAGSDRLIVLPTGRWQLPEAQHWKHHARLARLLPLRLARVLAGLDPAARVAHVGPAALEGWGGWGGRYLWLGQLEPERFRRLLAAADLLLSLNTTGATTLAAIAAGVPVLSVANAFQGRSVAELEVAAQRSFSDEQRAWLEQVVPLHPFRLWPLGLHRFLAPVLEANPFLEALHAVELLDEVRLFEAARGLLFDAPARARLLERQAAYRAELARLPTAGAAFRAVLRQ